MNPRLREPLPISRTLAYLWLLSVVAGLTGLVLGIGIWWTP